MKAFMLAGTNSGVGKTTISMALMSVFENVTPFKVGPDYIDTKFHERITGNKSYNLDIFLMGEEGVKYSFFKHQKNISIVEGVMGLYDGIDNSLDNFSSAHISRLLNLPVILIVDSKGKSTSIAAQVMGYQKFDERVNIAGVIINNVASEKTYKIFKEAIERYTSIKCLGYLPKTDEISLESRHLGLVQAEEIQNLEELKNKLKELAKKYIDIESLEKIATVDEDKNFSQENFLAKFDKKFIRKKIAIAKDEAFSFYYNDNIELLENLGFEITYISPLRDKKIPAVDLVYFGGGYPEIYAKALSENKDFIKDLLDKKANGLKIYAECGGFIYLSKDLKLLDDSKYELANIVPCSIAMTNRLAIDRFGYINILDEEDLIARAHEFHYSKIEKIHEDNRKYRAMKQDGREWKVSFSEKNLVAGYPHIHFFTSLKIIEDLMEV